MAHPIPDVFSDAEAAPLLCAGAVGYRALRLTQLVNGQSLGLTGFGGSAHLVLQLTRHLFPKSAVSVFARDKVIPQFRDGAGGGLGGRHFRPSAGSRERDYRHHSCLEASGGIAGQSCPRRATGDQCHPEGRQRSRSVAEAELPRASVDGTRDQDCGERHPF